VNITAAEISVCSIYGVADKTPRAISKKGTWWDLANQDRLASAPVTIWSLM